MVSHMLLTLLRLPGAAARHCAPVTGFSLQTIWRLTELAKALVPQLGAVPTRQTAGPWSGEAMLVVHRCRSHGCRQVLTHSRLYDALGESNVVLEAQLQH